MIIEIKDIFLGGRGVALLGCYMYLRKFGLINNSFSFDLLKTIMVIVLFQQGGFVVEIKTRVRFS